MSISKTITAAAVMALVYSEDSPLEDGLDSKVADFLPRSWDCTKIAGLTLRNLLRHEGRMWEYLGPGFWIEPPGYGLGEAPSTYLNMMQSVERGLSPPRRTYQNLNYGLFRIIIPYAVLNNGSKQLLDDFGEKVQLEFFDWLLGSAYVSFVCKRFSSPAAS